METMHGPRQPTLQLANVKCLNISLLKIKGKMYCVEDGLSLFEISLLSSGTKGEVPPSRYISLSIT